MKYYTSKKNRILFISVYLLCTTVIVGLTVWFQYRKYTYNVNLRMNRICEELQEQYPDVDINEIVHSLGASNTELESERNILAEYGIDIQKDSAISVSGTDFIIYVIVDMILVNLLLGGILYLMFKSFKKWDEKVVAITDELSVINAGDYSYNMEIGDENKLSILESEIYKTAVKCRESAENSLKDKENLKESLSDISHQLKTPLTSLLINLDNLEEYPELPEEKRRKLIGNAKRDTNKVNIMVQMLLKLSKLDAGVVEFDKKETSLAETVLRAAENVLALCELKGIELYYEDKEVLSDNVSDMMAEAQENNRITVMCDPYWEVEAYSNILKNGIEHAETKVSVKCVEYELYTEVIIENDGEEITHEEAEKIFTRYYRGETATVDSVGIGLSLADSIVRKDGGYILAEPYHRKEKSREETGTRFIVRYYKN